MRRMIANALCALILTLCPVLSPSRAAEPPAVPPPPLPLPLPPVEIPSRYDEHRWIVTPVTKARETLLFFTDSGGGMNLRVTVDYPNAVAVFEKP